MENTSNERNTNEEIIEQLVKKVNELDKRKVELPDYTKEFESLKIWIREQMPNYSKPWVFRRDSASYFGQTVPL